MGREINVSAGDRLDLQDTARVAPDALTLLVAAFHERQRQIGGKALVLDAVVEIAQEQGYTGTVDEAASVLRAAGFLVEIGPSGRPIAWRDG